MKLTRLKRNKNTNITITPFLPLFPGSTSLLHSRLLYSHPPAVQGKWGLWSICNSFSVLLSCGSPWAMIASGNIHLFPCRSSTVCNGCWLWHGRHTKLGEIFAPVFGAPPSLTVMFLLLFPTPSLFLYLSRISSSFLNAFSQRCHCLGFQA